MDIKQNIVASPRSLNDAGKLDPLFGKDGFNVSITNDSLGLTLNYTSWDEITEDIDDARIYGGIHFRFDQEAGALQGRRVGSYILRNYLRAVN